MQIQYQSEYHEVDADSTCDQLYTTLLHTTKHKDVYELWCDDEYIPKTDANLDTINIYDNCTIEYKFTNNTALIGTLISTLIDANDNENDYVEPVARDLLLHLVAFDYARVESYEYDDEPWWSTYLSNTENILKICEICIEAFEYVPDEMKTLDICMLVCTQYGGALFHGRM